MKNRSDTFWKSHSKRKTEGNYSTEFKDLITCMLQSDPHQRPFIADIIGHPWLASGVIATAQQVRAEIGGRQDVNELKAL